MGESSSNRSPRDLELELFKRIDEAVVDVRERVLKLEIQYAMETPANLRREITDLKMEIERLKTRVAPMLAGISMIGGGLIAWAVKSLT